MKLRILSLFLCAALLFDYSQGDCGVVPTISNGSPETEPETSAVGTKIKYTCDAGYEFQTPSSSTYELECLDTDSWDVIANCQKVNCPLLPTDAAGAGHDNTYGATIVMECTDPTKRIPGVPAWQTLTVKCQEDKTWDKYDPAAHPVGCVPIACENPLEHSVATDGSTAVGSSVTFTCDDGYVFNDGKQIDIYSMQCGANGMWFLQSDPLVSGLTCEPLQCNPIIEYYNLTQVDVNSQEVSVDVSVKISCKVGHEFNDSSIEKSITCQANQTWTLEPVEDCLPKLCAEVKVIEYGEADSTDNWYLSDVNFTCIDGFHFPDGSTYRLVTCTKYGTWTADVPDCTNMTIEVNAVKNDLTTELENARTFAYVLMSIVGLLGLATLVLDILTFKKQVDFLKRNLISRFDCLRNDDDESEIDSLDGEEIMRSSTISLGHGRITPAPSTVDLQLIDKSKQSSMNVVPEEDGNEAEHDTDVEAGIMKSGVPRTRLASAKNTIQKALARTMNLNQFIKSASSKQRNQFQSAALPLGVDNYGKLIEPRPPSPVKDESDDEESSEYTDSSESEEEDTPDTRK